MILNLDTRLNGWFQTHRKIRGTHPYDPCSPGRSCVEPPHAGEEMGYVLEGSILLTLGKKTYRIQKGETFYFPAGQEHWLEAGKWGATILWISSPPNF